MVMELFCVEPSRTSPQNLDISFGFGASKMKIISGILIILVSEMVLSTMASPFLYNAAPLFLQSIFRLSSGIPENGTQNVEDLRNSEEPTKLANFKAERQHLAKQQAEDHSSNEATPNFLQSKIEKILYKLRLISQLSGPLNFGGGQEHAKKEPDDFDFDFDSNEKNDTSSTIGHANQTTTDRAVTTTASDRTQRFSLNLPKQNIGADNDVNDGSVNKVNPGTIGVFLIEMLGTVLTLIYGAAVQNNENNTAPAVI